jgi:hypothetical protein
MIWVIFNKPFQEMLVHHIKFKYLHVKLSKNIETLVYVVRVRRVVFYIFIKVIKVVVVVVIIIIIIIIIMGEEEGKNCDKY